ncbi:hypothetical protein VNO80_26455 [Phaseolus coccineus]|uniref:F-box domain-containing protein n=1 Tax=Phaseolus coccineus TaxID=3886 RepID=A0AAN9LF09_PHACN
MQLRLRSLEFDRTLTIKVPNSCSLQQLIDTLSHTIASSPTLGSAEVKTVEMVDRSDEAMVVSTNSEPFFVRRLLKEALVDDLYDFKRLVFMVHQVVLDHGFVRIDKDSGRAVSCFHSFDDFPSPFSSMLSLRYTLPEILVDGGSHSVNLKFQTLGHFVNVCGGLSDDTGSRLHYVCLDKRKYVRLLEFILANGESKGYGKEVFEMVKMVKDRVALPLLMDVCEKGGLDLPPCFMKLPMELKGLILERVPGVDLAKVACTCSELRFLCSGNEMWKKKYWEKFGKKYWEKFGKKYLEKNGGESKEGVFKDLFALSWQTNTKKTKCLQRIVLLSDMLTTELKTRQLLDK